METSSFDCLLDGRLFPLWEKPEVYEKTYHVSAQHPAVSDQNPGTETLPRMPYEEPDPGMRVWLVFPKDTAAGATGFMPIPIGKIGIIR